MMWIRFKVRMQRRRRQLLKAIIIWLGGRPNKELRDSYIANQGKKHAPNSE